MLPLPVLLLSFCVELEFGRRIVLAVLIASVAFLAWYLRHVLVLAFAAVVVATLLVTFSWPVRRITSLNDRWSVAVTTLFISGWSDSWFR